MRIIAGKWKGRPLSVPRNRIIRPLGDKVRGALFNVTGDIEGFSVLDAYAGTGAVAFEALSRGAKLAEAIEPSPAALKLIQANAKALNVGEQLTLNGASVERWLVWPANKTAEGRYDLIVADPPYAKLRPEVLSRLGEFLLPEGSFVLSHSSKLETPELAGLKLRSSKLYGDSCLSFYKLAANR